MGDSRSPWFRLATDFWRNHKIANAGFLAGSLHLAGIAHSAEQLTDGFIPDGVVPILAAPMHGWVWVGEDGLPVKPCDVAASRPYSLAESLCDAGLWEEVDGGYQILGYLDHQPSRAEVEQARTAQSEAGKRGAAKRWRKASNGDGDRSPNGEPHSDPQRGTNGKRIADPMANQWGTDGTCTYTSTEVSPNGDTSREPRTRARATRLPDDFAVTDDMRSWAADKTPDVAVDYETEKFADYWRAQSGQRATKRDWVGTWRNWLRKAQEDAGRRRPQPTQQQPQMSTRDRKVAEVQALKGQLAARRDDDVNGRPLRALNGGVA